MAKVDGKKTARKRNPLVLACMFCGSKRVNYHGCHDDRGLAVFVKCLGCEAEGPHVRGDIDEDAYTIEKQDEAAVLWNSSFLDRPRVQRRAPRRRRPAPSKGPARPSKPNGAALDLEVRPAPPATMQNGASGLNGHA